MLTRVAFVLIAAFWVTMNVMLWRSEFNRDQKAGSAVPVERVWHKILTAPDDSSLEILKDDKRIGHCRWAAVVGEELATGKAFPEETEVEGMVKQLTGYTIDLDGNLYVDDLETRLRFNAHAEFSTNHSWQAFTVRGGVRPAFWEVQATAATQSLQIATEDENEKFERRYSFDDLRNPQILLRDFGAPAMLTMLAGQIKLPDVKAVALGLNWEARNDWLKIGRSPVRVYRLQARLVEKYQAVIFVSRVGEILRVELPNNIVLVNEALSF